MWVNPSATDFGAATEPTAHLTSSTTGNLDLEIVDRFYLRQDTELITPFIEVDEIRVGLSWADVTPKATGIGDLTNWDKIKVFPNPASDLLYIQNSENITLAKVNNILGQEILSKSVNSNSFSIEMGNMNVGVYILTLYDKNGNRISKRIIKN
jgi:hypothetical protein